MKTLLSFFTGRLGFSISADRWLWRLGVVPEIDLAPGFHFDRLALTLYLGPLVLLLSYTDRD